MEVARYQFYFQSDQGVNDASIDSPAYFKTYMINTLNLLNPDNHFVLKVQQLTIPLSYYQFNAANQSSTLQYAVVLSSSTLYSGSVIIPDGNYSICQIADQLSALLAQSILTNVPAITSCYVYWKYDVISNRFALRFIGNLIGGVAWEVYLSGDAIEKALGYTFGAFDFTVNNTWIYGAKQVNMYPLSQLYVVSTALSDSETYQCFEDETHNSSTTHSGIVAVAQIKCPSYTYYSYEFKNPIPVVLDRTTVDFLDFDLRDYLGNALYGLDQPWNITFSISEMSTDAERQQTLRTFINIPQPPPLHSISFLENRSKNIDLNIYKTSAELDLLRSKLQTSIDTLKNNVQKRKSPSSPSPAIYESSFGAKSTTYFEPTLASDNPGETKQETTDVGRSPKR
jgi:hypothetical protein